MPKVSVCIPVYGVEKYIERCARSLFEQTMADGIEFIFVNDCTKDKSMEILEKVLEEYPQRKNQVKIIHHETNQGEGAARNHAVAACKGDYIIHCDPDDWVDLNMYEAMYDKAIETNADMVYCQLKAHGFKKTSVLIPQEKIDDAYEYLLSLLQCQSHAGLYSKLVRKSIALSPTIVVPDQICMHEDTLRTVQMAYLCKKVAFIPNVYYNYQFNTNSISNSRWRRKDLESMQQTAEILDEKLLPKEKFSIGIKAFQMEILRCMIFHPEITSQEEFLEYQKKYDMRENIKYLKESRKIKILLYISLINYKISVFMVKCWNKLSK